MRLVSPSVNVDLRLRRSMPGLSGLDQLGWMSKLRAQIYLFVLKHRSVRMDVIHWQSIDELGIGKVLIDLLHIKFTGKSNKIPGLRLHPVRSFVFH